MFLALTWAPRDSRIEANTRFPFSTALWSGLLPCWGSTTSISAPMSSRSATTSGSRLQDTALYSAASPLASRALMSAPASNCCFTSSGVAVRQKSVVSHLLDSLHNCGMTSLWTSHPICAAIAHAVPPQVFCAETSAPRTSNNSTTSGVLVPPAADIRGVSRRSFRASISAPQSSRNATTSTASTGGRSLPPNLATISRYPSSSPTCVAARCRGFRPWWSLASTSAPHSNNCRAVSMAVPLA